MGTKTKLLHTDDRAINIFSFVIENGKPRLLLRAHAPTYLVVRGCHPGSLPSTPGLTMRPAIFDPFGERLDLRPVSEAACTAAPRRRRTRRIVGAVLFWALAAGLITARGAFFDPSTAFGPDAPARVAAQAVGPTQNLAAASDASVLR
ncbi:MULTISPECIES: hypothetical protein [Methylobacterium]|uniref:hypothetical protein n=1 Tax=Methylobacterium TaxID=407 RepID=UPI000AFB4CE9|nr:MULTISPECIES: hypothetical protein [Methylobacterium]MBK3400248.1 hypothetical protein [Methylobacterium ajmalii]MBK3411896.1 hypothetical protein [Methylobacterium ajmalii]MBK3425224.1 hypothetical protein [Methylobacterium ajmalii]MBZ6411637.1 hypothetical protein [Methylobacterium sp.]